MFIYPELGSILKHDNEYVFPTPQEFDIDTINSIVKQLKEYLKLSIWNSDKSNPKDNVGLSKFITYTNNISIEESGEKILLISDEPFTLNFERIYIKKIEPICISISIDFSDLTDKCTSDRILLEHQNLLPNDELILELDTKSTNIDLTLSDYIIKRDHPGLCLLYWWPLKKTSATFKINVNRTLLISMLNNENTTRENVLTLFNKSFTKQYSPDDMAFNLRYFADSKHEELDFKLKVAYSTLNRNHILAEHVLKVGNGHCFEC